ncbi:hypothetical protein N7379_11290 [Rhizobium pusense]|uniref:hypothetical protein n=1 Tax=Agrobacterium pusense TaxID=648995 RepID=UPI00244A66CB|nr:hypothetical protein [Agrobacterium pusense]MDH0115060.1 hypothetical protein [Agrobacterium pusense]
MSKPVFQKGFLALEDVANSLREARKVVDLIAIAAESTDPASILALPGISATAAMAGERMDELCERLDALMEQWRRERAA